MVYLLGYNFFGDGNAIDPMPTAVSPITRTDITAAEWKHFTVTNDTSDTSTDIPAQWINDMIINATFDHTLDGGSLAEIVGDIVGYKIKRRKLGDFDWTTLHYQEITDFGQLSFVIADNLAMSGVNYEYAFVPISMDNNGNQIEGQYIIKSILTNFNGIFISDTDKSYRLESGIAYGNTQSNQKIGVYEPFGKKYPVTVSNGITSYETGTLSGNVLPENYKPGQAIQRREIVAQRKLLVEFLNNRKPKLIRDWNSNAWLCMITTNPSTNYLEGSGMGMVSVEFGWTEIGDAEDRNDLYACGMIPTND